MPWPDQPVQQVADAFSILAGRNHHSNGVACIMELATGYQLRATPFDSPA